MGSGEEGGSGEAFASVLVRYRVRSVLYYGGWGQGGTLVEMAGWSTAVRVQSGRLKHSEK